MGKYLSRKCFLTLKKKFNRLSIINETNLEFVKRYSPFIDVGYFTKPILN